MHLAADEGRLDAAALVARARAPATSSRRGSAASAEICVTEHLHRFAAARGLLDQEWWQEAAADDVAAYRAALRAAARRRACRCSPASSSTTCRGGRPSCAAWAQAHGWDLVLGSVHWLGQRSASTTPTTRSGTRSRSTTSGQRYFEAVIAAAATGIYDVMAHPDLAKVFGHRAPRGRCASGSTPRRPRPSRPRAWRSRSRRPGCASPSASCTRRPTFLAACRRAGVPATLASDAHRPGGRGPRLRPRRGRAARRRVHARSAASAPRAHGRCPLAEPLTRVGVAYDAHRLVPGRPLVLGGVDGAVRARPRRPLGRRHRLPRPHRRDARRAGAGRHRPLRSRTPTELDGRARRSTCCGRPTSASRRSAGSSATPTAWSCWPRRAWRPHVDAMRAALAGGDAGASRSASPCAARRATASASPAAARARPPTRSCCWRG